MTAVNLMSLILAAALAVFLGAALLLPERSFTPAGNTQDSAFAGSTVKARAGTPRSA